MIATDTTILGAVLGPIAPVTYPLLLPMVNIRSYTSSTQVMFYPPICGSEVAPDTLASDALQRWVLVSSSPIRPIA